MSYDIVLTCFQFAPQMPGKEADTTLDYLVPRQSYMFLEPLAVVAFDDMQRLCTSVQRAPSSEKRTGGETMPGRSGLGLQTSRGGGKGSYSPLHGRVLPAAILSKFPGQVLKIAAALHLAEYALENPRTPESNFQMPKYISMSVFQKALVFGGAMLSNLILMISTNPLNTFLVRKMRPSGRGGGWGDGRVHLKKIRAVGHSFG